MTKETDKTEPAPGQAGAPEEQDPIKQALQGLTTPVWLAAQDASNADLPKRAAPQRMLAFA